MTPLVRLLAQLSPARLAGAIVTSVLSGAADMGTTICVLEYLRSGSVQGWQFCVAAMVAVAVGRYARSSMNRMAARATVRLRRRLIRSVLHVPLLDLERIGSSRLLVAFTSDLANVASAIRNLASLFANATILLACLAYVGWLSPVRMVTVSALCALCIGGAVLLRSLEKRHRHTSRDAWDRVLGVYTAVIEGAKELKVSRSLARRVLVAFEGRLRDQQQSTTARGRYSDLIATWTNAMFYVILGVAVFGPFGDEGHLRLGFGLLALLRIRRPLGSIVTDSSAFADASVALRRIADAGLALSDDHSFKDGGSDPIGPKECRSLELDGLRFSYDDEAAAAEDRFALGPLTARFGPGEIVFIAGGNGGGKTTLAKLLTGLYQPTAGSILFNGEAVWPANARWYQGKIAAIFSDVRTFDGIVDPPKDDVDESLEKLAARLKLQTWLQSSGDRDVLGDAEVPSGRSTAERRRIALLMAVLDNRPIMLFDEWAADQDFAFKDFFYNELLADLKAAGKLVIVISHDERYFGVADRILWLERSRPPVWRSAPPPGGPTSDGLAPPPGREAVSEAASG